MEMDTPMEYEARWARIEALQEANTRDIAALTASQRSHSRDIAALTASQRSHASDIAALTASQRSHASDITELYKITGEIADGQEALQTSQQKTEKAMEVLATAMADLAVAQKISELAQAETQGKLDALIHMWDDWIRDRSGIKGAPGPAA